MNAARFRALALPEAVEGAHVDHPDFRVGGKIFATLGPGERWGGVKLAPWEQEKLVAAEADAYEPFAGAWGKSGFTRVVLEKAHVASVRRALELAWRNTAPKKLVREHYGD